MKHKADTIGRCALDLWKSVALIAIASLALNSHGVAHGGGLAPDGDTVGSHPSTAGERTVFFIEGPAALIQSHLVHTTGAGPVTAVTATTPGNIRYEYSPGLRVVVDMSLFANPNVRSGFRVPMTRSATAVRWDLGTHQTKVQRMSGGAIINLPVTRLHRSGMLQQGLGLDTYHAATLRTSYSVISNANNMVIRVR